MSELTGFLYLLFFVSGFLLFKFWDTKWGWIGLAGGFLSGSAIYLVAAIFGYPGYYIIPLFSFLGVIFGFSGGIYLWFKGHLSSLPKGGTEENKKNQPE